MEDKTDDGVRAGGRKGWSETRSVGIAYYTTRRAVHVIATNDSLGSNFEENNQEVCRVRKTMSKKSMVTMAQSKGHIKYNNALNFYADIYCNRIECWLPSFECPSGPTAVCETNDSYAPRNRKRSRLQRMLCRTPCVLRKSSDDGSQGLEGTTYCTRKSHNADWGKVRDKISEPIKVVGILTGATTITMRLTVVNAV